MTGMAQTVRMTQIKLIPIIRTSHIRQRHLSMWSHLFVPDVSLAEKVVRTILVYLFLVFGLRLAGKREMSQLNSFDLVVLLLLANTVQNAIIGNDNSLVGGVFGAAVLLAVNTLLVRTLHH